MEKDKIILIPSFNELASLKKICKQLTKYKFEFIILDDCSTDSTDKWLKRNKIRFIRNKKNLGYEKNLLNGFIKVSKIRKINTIITFDGDGQHKVSDVVKLIKLKYHQKFDLIVCDRKKVNRWSENILSFFFYVKYGIRDPISGLKVYNKTFLKKILKNISSNHFLVDVISLCLEKNYAIKNFSISAKKVKHSRIGGSLKVHLKILKNLKFIV